MLMGDFNCVRKNEEREGSGYGGGIDSSSKLLNDLVADFHLQDVAVVIEGADLSFTFHSDKVTVKSRIDFIFCSYSLKVQEYEVVPVAFSDHSVISGHVNMEVSVDFGRGVWKLNCSLLEEDVTCMKFKSFYDVLLFKKHEFGNVLEWWDWAKKEVAIFFRKMGRKNARRRREEEQRLVNRLHFLFKC